MTSEPYATRRELDILKSAADTEHAAFRARFDALDAGGGIIALQVQMVDAAKEIAKLQVSVDAMRTDVDKRFDAHMDVHESEARGRASSRRWLAGIVIAAIAAVDGPLVTLLLARR